MIFVDIDGTCADLTHRLHHLHLKKDWKSFLDPAEVSKDKPVESTRRLLWATQEGAGPHQQIIYVSGRPHSLWQQTQAWLKFHGFPSGPLHMRRDGDFRPDYLVKEEILHYVCGPDLERKPSLVIDDRPQVCDMWRRHGIPVVQLPWHEEEAQPKNRGLLTLMIGPSGAGKSTFLTLVKHSYENEEIDDIDYPEFEGLSVPMIFSSDELREKMFGDRSDQTHNAEVFAALHALVRAHLTVGNHCVIDATNLRRRDRLDAVALAQGGPVQYIVLDRRDKKPWHGNIDVVRKHEAIFASQLKDILSGDALPNVTVYDRRTM